ncbi:LysR family transcriptional regulator [Mesosutterella sp. AGMB02718]|uniref:LysR family transcriptional regulator n=1 Tax=Mesosutterella faecium TaxID=2925194 RepID=A0ABT7ING3_9BURK|nr:LysR family transcriptional regulator [Mesosutterella sp. AGMB02718]MDL2059919.1 LysR family transcriptional regulator [Mesosutterella sp. AGMB02718]
MVQNERAALPSSEELELLAGLFRTESLRDAAASLRISNSTASRRLSEMRARFSDPLFTRSGSRLLPTPRMKEIAAKLFPLLDSLEHFYDAKAFEPSQLKGQFRILTTDNNFLNILSPVLPRISREAPELELEVMPLRRNGMWQLISGKADLAIYAFPEYRREIRAAPLEKDRYCLLLRRGHPAARLWLREGELTLAALSPYTQIMNPRFSRTLRDPCGYERGPARKGSTRPFSTPIRRFSLSRTSCSGRSSRPHAARSTRPRTSCS